MQKINSSIPKYKLKTKIQSNAWALILMKRHHKWLMTKPILNNLNGKHSEIDGFNFLIERNQSHKYQDERTLIAPNTIAQYWMSMTFQTIAMTTPISKFLVLGGSGKATLYRDQIMIDLVPQWDKVTILWVIVREEAFCMFWLHQQRAHVATSTPLLAGWAAPASQLGADPQLERTQL